MKMNLEQPALLALLTELGELVTITSTMLAHLGDIENRDELKSELTVGISNVAASCAFVQKELDLDAEQLLSGSVDKMNDLETIKQFIINNINELQSNK